MIVFYFTATGNSLYVAKQLTDKVYSIPQVLLGDQKQFESEVIGIVTPIFFHNVPPLVHTFLRQVTLKSRYFFAILTFGASSGIASRSLSKYGHENGIHFDYINELLMIDNYIPFFDMKKEKSNKEEIDLAPVLSNIKNDIVNRKQFIKDDMPFLRSLLSLGQKLVIPFIDKVLFADAKNFSAHFSIDRNCVGCAVCTKVCPMGNISIENKKPLYASNCIRCLACIHHCPHTAIHLKCERSNDRYINSHVRLQDIIQSNNCMDR